MNLELQYGGRRLRTQLPDNWQGVNTRAWPGLMLIRAAIRLREEMKSPPGAAFGYMQRVVTGADLTSYPNMLDGIAIVTGWKHRHVSCITPEAAQMIADSMMWIADKPGHMTNYMPRIWLIWRGPKNQLSDLIWKRYALAEEAVRGWGAAAKGADVTGMKRKERSLFAALYSPMGIWAPRFSLFAARLMPRRKLELVLLNYQGMRDWLMDVYKPAFPKGSKEAPADQWRRLSIAMSGTKFGDMKNTLKENMHNVLAYIVMMEEERVRMEREMKRNS